MEHYIVRTEEITGYQDTVSKGDIVVLDDKSYVVIYTLDQEVTQIDPTIKHKYTLLVSDEVEVSKNTLVQAYGTFNNDLTEIGRASCRERV